MESESEKQVISVIAECCLMLLDGKEIPEWMPQEIQEEARRWADAELTFRRWNKQGKDDIIIENGVEITTTT